MRDNRGMATPVVIAVLLVALIAGAFGGYMIGKGKTDMNSPDSYTSPIADSVSSDTDIVGPEYVEPAYPEGITPDTVDVTNERSVYGDYPDADVYLLKAEAIEYDKETNRTKFGTSDGEKYAIGEYDTDEIYIVTLMKESKDIPADEIVVVWEASEPENNEVVNGPNAEVPDIPTVEETDEGIKD